MSYDLTTAAQTLVTELATAHPDWRVRDADETARTNSLGVTLTIEQGDVSAEYQGQRLAVGHVAADFHLVLSAPETDPQKGTRHIFACLPALLATLDASDTITWAQATKGRDAAGTFYTIPLTLFATTTTEE